MNSTTEICEDKERVKLRKEMLVQSKLEHCSVFGSYLEFQMSQYSQIFTQTWCDIGLQLSCEHKNLTRPFSSPNHSNKRRSLNLSYSPNIVQCLAYIWSSRSPNDLYFFSWKAESISYNFHVFQRTQFGWQHFCFIQTRR